MKVGIFVGICSAKPWHGPACGRSGRSQPLRLLKQRLFPASLLSDVDGANERLPGIGRFATVRPGRGYPDARRQRMATVAANRAARRSDLTRWSDASTA